MEEASSTAPGVPVIETTWNDTRDTVTITATADDVANIKIYAGIAPNDYSYSGANSLNISNLPHVPGSYLYIRAVALDEDDNEVTCNEAFATVPIPHPILGIAKTCDGEKNIIDFVEKKNGVWSERWQSGKRIVTIGECGPQPGVDGWRALSTTWLFDGTQIIKNPFLHNDKNQMYFEHTPECANKSSVLGGHVTGTWASSSPAAVFASANSKATYDSVKTTYTLSPSTTYNISFKVKGASGRLPFKWEEYNSSGSGIISTDTALWSDEVTTITTSSNYGTFLIRLPDGTSNAGNYHPWDMTIEFGHGGVYIEIVIEEVSS